MRMLLSTYCWNFILLNVRVSGSFANIIVGCCTLWLRLENELKLLCHLLNQPMYWPKDLDYKTLHMIDLLLKNHEKVRLTSHWSREFVSDVSLY